MAKLQHWGNDNLSNPESSRGGDRPKKFTKSIKEKSEEWQNQNLTGKPSPQDYPRYQV